jgi:hypothetical protein
MNTMFLRDGYIYIGEVCPFWFFLLVCDGQLCLICYKGYGRVVC